MVFKSRTLRVLLIVSMLFQSTAAFPQAVAVVPVPSAVGPPSGGSPGTGSSSPPSGVPSEGMPQAPSTPGAVPSTPGTGMPPGAGMSSPPGLPGLPSSGAAAGTQPGLGQAIPGFTGPIGPVSIPPSIPEGRQPSAIGGQQPPPETPTAKGVEETSPFEQFVMGKIPATISFDIKQFGYSLFLQGLTGFGPDRQVPAALPVGPDYVIGPGDEIRISVWGGIEANWNNVVDRDGNINLPRVGTLGVTGLTFQELREMLLREFSKYYKDFEMNVSMGTLRSMTVYVVGNARDPGAYSVSSLSTVINALVVSHGPSKMGTLRDVQLKRNGETIAHLDLYDFLISGDKTKDVRLLPEDVIFIPPIGPIVGVAGNVDRPAIYELKGRTTLSAAIKMAGGPTAAAYLQRVQVERVHQRQTKIIVDLNLERIKGAQDIVLQDGDIVKVFPIVPLVTNKVVLQGNVRRPGEYEWKPGMRARDLIPSMSALLPETFLDYAMITRLVPPDYHQEYRSFELGALLQSSDQTHNILLEPYDVVTVYNKWEVVQREKVRITGAVNKPGEFDFRPNMKLSDLLRLAGGFRKHAYTEQAELTRVTPTPTGPRTDVIVVNPVEALAGYEGYDMLLQQDDYLFVRSVPDWQLYRTASIRGEVRFPGDYALKRGERLSSLIDRAGGYTDNAYIRGATFVRQSLKDEQQRSINEMVNRMERELLAISSAEIGTELTADEAQVRAVETKQKQVFLNSLRQIQAKGRMVVNLEQIASFRNTAVDVELEEGDVLYVPANPQVVMVIGAVQNGASFVYEPKKDYAYYIDRAGGFTRNADKGKIYIIKADGSTTRPGGGFFWNVSTSQWESGSPGQLEPGDTIVVPDQLEKVAWLRQVKDLVQVLYQAALGAAVVIKVFD